MVTTVFSEYNVQTLLNSTYYNSITIAERFRLSFDILCDIWHYKSKNDNIGTLMRAFTVSEMIKETTIMNTTESIVGTTKFIVGTTKSGCNKDSVDYLCDGADDQLEINGAINALPETGGTIELMAGTYKLSGPVTIAERSNIHIYGKDAVLCAKLAGIESDDPLPSVDEYSVFVLDKANHCYVDVRCTADFKKHGSVRSNGVYLRHSNYNTISGQQTNNAYNFSCGVYLDNSCHNLVWGYQGNTSESIFAGSESVGVYLVDSHYNKVGGMQGNSSGALCYGVRLLSSTYNIVSGVQANGSMGVLSPQPTKHPAECFGVYLEKSDNNEINGRQESTSETISYGVYVKESSGNSITSVISNTSTLSPRLLNANFSSIYCVAQSDANIKLADGTVYSIALIKSELASYYDPGQRSDDSMWHKLAADMIDKGLVCKSYGVCLDGASANRLGAIFRNSCKPHQTETTTFGVYAKNKDVLGLSLSCDFESLKDHGSSFCTEDGKTACSVPESSSVS
jgi:hypothetical protein